MVFIRHPCLIKLILSTLSIVVLKVSNPPGLDINRIIEYIKYMLNDTAGNKDYRRYDVWHQSLAP